MHRHTDSRAGAACTTDERGSLSPWAKQLNPGRQRRRPAAARRTVHRPVCPRVLAAGVRQFRVAARGAGRLAVSYAGNERTTVWGHRGQIFFVPPGCLHPVLVARARAEQSWRHPEKGPEECRTRRLGRSCAHRHAVTAAQDRLPRRTTAANAVGMSGARPRRPRPGNGLKQKRAKGLEPSTYGLGSRRSTN